jgi:hypothetical protein
MLSLGEVMFSRLSRFFKAGIGRGTYSESGIQRKLQRPLQSRTGNPRQQARIQDHADKAPSFW